MLLQPDGGKSREGGLEDPLVLNVEEVGMLFFGRGSCGQERERNRQKGRPKKITEKNQYHKWTAPPPLPLSAVAWPVAYSQYDFGCPVPYRIGPFVNFL
jgi:hypothetical protein